MFQTVTLAKRGKYPSLNPFLKCLFGDILSMDKDAEDIEKLTTNKTIIGNLRECHSCKESKADIEFNFKSVKRNILNTECKKCTRKRYKSFYQRNRHQEIIRAAIKAKKHLKVSKAFIVDYLKDHPCIDCLESNPVVLEFDHIGGSKFNNISYMVTGGWSLKRLEEEIEKCEVRCANCHRIKTANEQGWTKLIGD